jgi:hypothetical protein
MNFNATTHHEPTHPNKNFQIGLPIWHTHHFLTSSELKSKRGQYVDGCRDVQNLDTLMKNIYW